MRFASALCAVILTWAHPCLAEEPPSAAPPSVQLEVVSTTPCGSQGELMTRVRARVPAVRFVEQQGELVVRATFSGVSSGGVAGELVLLRDGRATPLRQLEAESCEDAVDGIALILAVTLDPTATRDPGAAPPEASTGSGEGADATDASPRVDSNPAPLSEGSAARGSAAPGDETYPSDRGSYPDYVSDPGGERPTTPVDTPWFVTGVVGGEGTWGPAPGWMPGFSGYVMVGVEEASPWSPAFAIGGASSWSPDLEQSGGTASFTLNVVTIEPCPLRFPLSPFAVRVCASGIIGRFSATGSHTQNPSRETRPFVALSALGTLAWDVGSHVEVSARVAPRVNLFKDEFEFGDRVFHTVRLLTFSASLGVGLRWP